MKKSLLLVLLFPAICTAEPDPAVSCPKPLPGNHDNACAALAAADAGKSPHRLDKWLLCRLDSESMGYRTAGFYSDEVSAAWEAEIKAHLARLGELLSKSDMANAKRDHAAWLAARPKREQAIRKKYEDEQGSAFAIIAESEVIDLTRRQALELGCRVDKQLKQQSPSNGPKRQGTTTP